MSIYIQSPSVPCPYCGRGVEVDVNVHKFAEELPVRKMIECPGDGGCGRSFAVFGTISVQFAPRCLKIEGQEA